jgi:acyl carrier protein
MSEQEIRLLQCFASVFPGLSDGEIRETSAQSNGAWDSLSTVTLAAVIQEEFGLDVDEEILPCLDSFKAFRDYVCRAYPATN